MKFRLLKTKFLNNWSVKIISLAAAVILYYINYYNTLDTQKIDVPIRILLPTGYALTAPHVETVALTVKGSKELDINKLNQDDFEVTADLSGQTKIKSNEAITVNVQYEKKGNALGKEPLSVLIKPQFIIIKLEKKTEKWVTVVPNIIPGSPPEGYTVTSMHLNPEKILITGPHSRVNAIESLMTEPISFENRKKDFFMVVKPVFPDIYIKAKEVSVLEFFAGVSEIISEKEIFDINLTALNIDESLILNNALPPGMMKFKAAHEVFAKLEQGAVRMIINCENIKQQGKYTLRITPEYPPAMVLLDYAPKEVLIDLIPRK